jgi:hypothetical protein
MKKVQLIAYENIVGIDINDIDRLNGIFKSPIEFFDESKSNHSIANEMIDKYEHEIGNLFNPSIQINFIE